MLFEKQEYELYMNSPEKVFTIPSIFMEESENGDIKGNGLPRALTIIARHFIYDEYKYDEVLVGEKYPDEDSCISRRAEIVANVENELINWFNGALKKYWYSVNKSSKSKKDDEWTRFSDRKLSMWQTDNIYKTFDMHENSEYAINFKIIIADAVYAGPLRNRYLVLKKNFTENVGVETEKTTYKNIADASNTVDNLRRCLMVIAFTLLKEEGHTISNTTLAFNDSYINFAKQNHKLKYLYKGGALVCSRSGSQYVDSDFMNKYEVCLIDEEEYLKEPKSDAIFDDDKYFIFVDDMNKRKKLNESLSKLCERSCGENIDNNESSDPLVTDNANESEDIELDTEQASILQLEEFDYQKSFLNPFKKELSRSRYGLNPSNIKVKN